jgi:hypothetical protein
MEDFFTLLQKIGAEGLHWWRENEISKKRLSLHGDVGRELRKYIVSDINLRDLLKRRKQLSIDLIPLHSNHLGSIFFLRPIWDLDREGAFRPSLQLWVVKAGAKEIIGFRFEFPDRTMGTHVYPHVQLTREFDDGGGSPVCGCSILTITYPAIPLPVWDALDLLLAAYVAVRGYRENSVERLQQMLRTVKERPLRNEVINRLTRIAIDVGI